MRKDERYNKRGVSASKEDVHNAIKNIDKGVFPRAFCKIVPDYLGGDEAYCNIMHADGAGTKSSLAYMYWKETGDLSVWKGIAQDALIMNIDDLLCVGAVDNILLSSTIGRNKNLIPGEVIAAIINGTEELLEEYRKLGVSIYSTGGETADVGDLVRTIIVDSTVTCRMKRKDVIDNANIRPGDVIIGLSSYGQATYETEYNGGMGSFHESGNGICPEFVLLPERKYGSEIKPIFLHSYLLPRHSPSIGISLHILILPVHYCHNFRGIFEPDILQIHHDGPKSSH